MLELVVDYDFAGGTATDRSGFANHGQVIGAVRAGGGLAFDGFDDRVVTPPSASLERLGAIRVVVAGRPRVCDRRRTLVEGYLAFSLVVEGDGSLYGTVYTGNAWRGIASQAGTLQPGRDFVASWFYDGRDTFLISVDGHIVGERGLNAGPVESVCWPFGLSIGAWPDGDRRCFVGELSAVQVWRLAPPIAHSLD